MKKRLWLVLITVFITILILVTIFYFTIRKEKDNSDNSYSSTSPTKDAVYKRGKNLSNGQCQGMEVKKLGTLPMNYNDFSMIIPYGLVVGDHVTPIDHQYFSPSIFDSPHDTYEVKAMADSQIVDIQPRVKPTYTEYRLVFSISCRLFYYYDLVTSLAPSLKKEFEESQSQKDFFNRPINIAVKEGQVIGRIGGQTLDFAVWDTQKILAGFVNPNSYDEERWKIHTVDPLDYYSDALKKLALSKYVRTAIPVSGKIDHDVDGRLVGNWFKEGTEGYRGTKRERVQNYSQTHLAIVPNHLDPSFYMASFGNFAGQFRQFVIKNPAPDPKEMSAASGPVKYDLADFFYVKENDEQWDGKSFAKNVRLKMGPRLAGCSLYQLITDRKLKVETFPNLLCSRVSDFSSQATTYTR